MKSSSPISIARLGSRTVLTPKESITFENRQDVQAAFEECIKQQRSDVILDCKAVNYMDSEALELLVHMHEELRNQGNRLKIIGLNDVCRDIFIASRLLHLYVYQDIHEAIRSER